MPKELKPTAPSMRDSQSDQNESTPRQSSFSRDSSGENMKEKLTQDVETPPPAPPGPMHPSQFPDGGTKAWLCVAGGFCCAFCSFGWINAIGVFQEYYQYHLLRVYSPSEISWILSLGTFLMFFGALPAGKLHDNYGPRPVLIVGSFMHVFGLMMASLSTKYYQLILSQGVCSPIGASIILYPAMSSVITWFFKRRALAIGIMTSGSSLGGVIFPIMVQRLIPETGFGWAMRASAFLILGLQICACAAVTSRIPPAPRPLSLKEFVAPFQERQFAAVCTAGFFGVIGLFIPFNYITLSGLTYGMSKDLSNYVIPLLNAASTFGRIFPGWAADSWGRINMQIVMCAFSAIVTFALWLPARGNAPIIVYAILYGFSSGAFVSLSSPVVAQVTSDMRTMAVRTGCYFFVASFAALIGNPIGGKLLTADNFHYLYLSIFTGVAMAVSAALWIFAKSLCKGQLLKRF